MHILTQVDEALDFNGNIFFGAMGNCCIGCAAWQRCFNLMPRCVAAFRNIGLISCHERL